MGKDFFVFFDEELATLVRVKSASTVRNYHTALNALARYLQQRSLLLSDISRQLMQDFEQWLRRRGLCRNTTSAYMRSLQSLFNRAVDAGLTPERNPFRRVFTGNERTEKRTLSKGEVSRLLSIHVPTHNQRLHLYADVLRFSFALCGMPFVDVAHLRWRQIKGKMLYYHRRKTGERVSVRLESQALVILQQYKSVSASADDYVFPILRHGCSYAAALSRYNRALSRLAGMAGVKHLLTSYVVRHSWASLSNQVHTPPSVISKGLGHTNIRTTATYMASLSSDALHHYNRRLLNDVFRC